MSNSENIAVTEERTDQEIKTTKIGRALDRFFHYYERGSNMKQEILAGLSVFLVSICALFLNMAVLTDAFSDDVPYLGMYLASTIISFIGTLLIGLIANLPLVQCSSLSMSSVFISMLGAESGLSYYNLLAVTFICSIIYTILMAVPFLRRKIYEAIPTGVRKALPIVTGLLIAFTALEHIGIIDQISDPTTISSDSRPTYTLFCIAMGVVGIVITLLFKLKRAKHPFMYGFIVTTILFYLVASLTGSDSEIFSAVYSTNRAWIAINPDANGEMYSITDAFSQISFGAVFTEGFDFSSFTSAGGSVFLLFVEGILVFLFMGMYESEGNIRAADQNGHFLGEKQDKQIQKALIINAATDILSPIFNVAPVSVSRESGIATGDGGRTGLSSVICSIGYLIMMFQWFFFMIFATSVPVVPEYGHAGYVFSTVVDSTFQIAAGVIFVLSISSLKGLKDCDYSNFYESVPFILTIIFGICLQNIIYGVAVGVIAYTLMRLLSFKREEVKSLKVTTGILSVFFLFLILFIFY